MITPQRPRMQLLFHVFQINVLFWNNLTFPEKLQYRGTVHSYTSPAPVNISRTAVPITPKKPTLAHR